jgi:hypothetical protein
MLLFHPETLEEMGRIGRKNPVKICRWLIYLLFGRTGV